MRRFQGIALLVAAGALGGCFELREEVVVNPDGSVRFSLDTAVPEFILVFASSMGDMGGGATGIPNWFGSTDSKGDSLVVRDYLEEDLHHYVAERPLRSVEQLAELSSDTTDARPQYLMPAFEVARSPNGTVRMLRRFSLSRMRAAMPDGAMEHTTIDADPERQKENTARTFAGRYYRLTVRAPRIVSSSGTVSADRTKAEWKVPMAEAMGDSTRTYDVEFTLSK